MPGFTESILDVLDEVFSPLITALKTPEALGSLLANLGWTVDPGFASGGSADLSSVTAPFTQVETAFTSLSQDIQAQNYGNVPSDVADVVNAIEAVAAPSGLTELLQPFDSPAFWETLPGQLYPYLLYIFLQGYSPVPFGILRFLGVLQAEAMPADATATPPTVAYTKYTVDWDNLYAAVKAPQAILPSVYGWGSAQFNHAALLNAVADLFRMLPIFRLFSGSPAVIEAPSSLLGLFYNPATLPADGFEMVSVAPLFFMTGGSAVIPAGKISLIALPIPATPNGPPTATGIALFPLVTGGLGTSFTITDDVTVTLNGDFQTIPVIAEIQPGPAVTVSQDLGTTTTLDAEARLDAKAPSAAGPWMLLGTSDSSYLSFSQAHLRLLANGPVSNLTYEIDGGFDNAQLVIQFGDADSFISEIFGGQQQTFTFGASLTWSSKTGFGFNGQSNLAVNVPVHQTLLGAVTITSVSVALVPAPTGTQGIAADVSVSANFSLGPVSVSVQQIGLEVDITDHQSDHAGSFGDVGIQLDFKPPTGLGLALDAAPVSGSGFVAFDAVNRRYLGALALMVGDVSISAVGVLDTVLPGGAPGYSLVVVASADFPPVELGFGFSLAGIGGLVGVNRTTDVPALQTLARAGQLDSLMFPADLANRAPQVAASLEQLFPAATGHFIIGPAVRIEWGTGGMVDAEVGVFIELSDSGGGLTLLRIALLGWVHLTLPDALTPVADLTLDVLGVADLTAQTLSLDASLRNSAIAGFPLTGQAALRASWGASPSFVFAVGGFNPHFAVPAGFPALQRLVLSIGGSDPRLRLSAYLALTSNTVQLGCSADLYASAGPAAVAASLSFDALVQFQPFGLIVDLTISATVLLGGSPVLSLSLDLHVSGPTPWTVTGSASFQILLCSFTVPISIHAGPQPPPQPPPTVDLDTLLTGALAEPTSWQTGPPAGRGAVTVRSQSTPNPAVHPLGTLTVRQHAVPLEVRLQCYGPDPLDPPCSYQITAATLGVQAVQADDVTGFFAPAQFLTMTDAQKLSAPSFELMTAGATLGSAAVSLPQDLGQAGATVADTVSAAQFDVLLIDSPDPATTTAATARTSPAATTAAASPPAAVVSSAPPVTLPAAVLATQLPAAAAAVNGTAGRGPARYAAPGCGIGTGQPTYAAIGMDLAATSTGPAVIAMAIPTTVAAAASRTAGVAGQDWQVIYTSEVPG